MSSTTTLQQALAPTDATRGTSVFGNVYRFAGRRFDDQAGLYYNRHRSYEPRSGRFLSRDPLGYGDGPNLYGYGQNAPPNRIDPLGLRWLLPIARKYQKKSETFVTYVNKIKDAIGRTEVYYSIFLECYCLKGPKGKKKWWYMRVGFGLVYKIKLERKLLEASERKLLGVYGHELKHAQSIEEEVQKNISGLVKLFRGFETGPNDEGYGSKSACNTERHKAYPAIQSELLRIIKAGAGHDDDDKTTKPRERERVDPAAGQRPGTEKEAKAREKEVENNTKGKKYIKYNP